MEGFFFLDSMICLEMGSVKRGFIDACNFVVFTMMNWIFKIGYMILYVKLYIVFNCGVKWFLNGILLE